MLRGQKSFWRNLSDNPICLFTNHFSGKVKQSRPQETLLYLLVKSKWFNSVKLSQSGLIIVFEKAFKMMKNGVYFNVIAILAAELFKILIYAN